MTSPTIPFTAHSINPTTFCIVENSPFSKSDDDKPQIYLKFFDDVIVIIDTGTVRKPTDTSMTLKEFIETIPVAANDGLPLNGGKEREYVLVLTHCHFDRIGGISEFPTSVVGASSADLSFFAPSTLPTHSLCTLAGLPTPLYTPTIYLEDLDIFPNVSIRETPLSILHTPGHTPDSLTVYDSDEAFMYVGDMLHENTLITFPEQGNVEQYLQSLDRLLSFVHREGDDVKIAAGRGGWDADAHVLIKEAKALIERALRGEVKRVSGENGVSEYGEGRGLGFSGPERIFEEGRKAIGCPPGQV